MYTVERYILQLWHSVYLEAIQLADTVEQVPETCACGDALAHLDGLCRCCSGHKGTANHQHDNENCNDILTRLRASLSILCKDFSKVTEPMETTALMGQRMELRRGVFLSTSDLEKICQVFEGTDRAIAGFRQTCALTDLQRVKRHCRALREHFEQVNVQLQEG